LRPKRSERWHPYTVKRVLDRVGREEEIAMRLC
jgi:hypothetical protein